MQPATQWGWSEVLQNKANYLLEVIAWQNANEGVKKSKQTPKPEPFVPEFMKDRSINNDAVKYETEDIKAILSMPRK